MALDGQSSFTESDTRRFGSTLRFLGVTNCTDVIDRPDLWVKALELSIPRAGENFKETYIELLVGARVTP